MAGVSNHLVAGMRASFVSGNSPSDDKRRSDAEWREWSDREIARRCKVSHPFVTKARADMAPVTGNVSSEEEAPRTSPHRGI